MSYYEYIIKGELSVDFEEKVKNVLDLINTGRVLFAIQKYTDEEVETDKKRRVMVLVSPINVINQVYDLFKNIGVEIEVYYKQRIM
jgi:hypothetical protein